eukprot:GILJ01027052.1.p1 GENE.GILJ01027052.1~~GILJ01027052.1.p1  ORF type:complete len:291 (-),score=26.38 GILJ01027052.1:14-886(-)
MSLLIFTLSHNEVPRDVTPAPITDLLSYWDALRSDTSRGDLMSIIHRPQCGVNRETTKEECKALSDRGFITRKIAHEVPLTPLMLATFCGRLDAMEDLITAGATVQRNNAETALHIAAQQNNPEAISLLVACGADANALDDYGYSPLLAAVDTGLWSSPIKTKTIRRLFSLDARLDGPDEGRLLYFSLTSPCTDNLQALVDQGANVDRLLEGGFPMLHFTCLSGSAFSRLLLDAGVDLEAVDQDKDTSLHQAADRGRIACIKLFAAEGANIHALNKKNRTPLQVLECPKL